MSVSRNDVEFAKQIEELQAMSDEPLHPDLQPWVEDGQWGPMLRHPLVYSVPLTLPGYANRTYLYKQKAKARAIEEEDWHNLVFLHERPYRLDALLSVVGTTESGDPIPLASVPEHWALAADVWVDSENIQQNIEQWRALFCNGAGGLWLGEPDERAAFEALPEAGAEGSGLIRAWRGGAVGDWSWTTDRKTAEFFSRRSGLPVRGHLIPRSDVFGYLTRRSEAELLVKFTEFRRSLVYPVSGNPDDE
jgi:hypothetical protein